MRRVGVRELKNGASELLRDVRENGEMIELTHHGRVFARIMPVRESEDVALGFGEWEAEADALAQEIGKRWPAGVSAVDAVREGRREL